MGPVSTIILIGTIIFIVLAVVIFFLVLFINRRVLEHQRRLLQVSFEAQENERQRIGRNIHDDIGPLLSTIKLSVSRFKALEDASSSKRAAEVCDHLDNAIQMVRVVSRDLSPSVLSEYGIVIAAEELSDRINQSDEIKCEVKVEGREEELGQSIELAVYRIIQELCNNAIRHAEASLLLIIFNYRPNSLLIEVKDNGKGFIPPKKLNSGADKPGIGLRNIEARAKQIEGKLTFNSIINQGTSALLTVPMK